MRRSLNLPTCPSDLAMQCYLIEPRDQIFVKDYGFLPFDKIC